MQKWPVYIQKNLSANRVALANVYFGQFFFGSKKGILALSYLGEERMRREYIHRLFSYLSKEISRREQQITYDQDSCLRPGQADLMEPVDGEIFSAQMHNASDLVMIKCLEVVEHNAQVTVDASNIENKSKVKIKDLSPEFSPGVNLYLHMPENKKYFLYLRDIAILSVKQHKKLDVANARIFVKNEDINKFKETVNRNKTIQKLFSTKKNSSSAA